MALLIFICQSKQLRAAAFVLLVELLSFSSSFASSATMQVLVLLRQVSADLFAVGMLVVYRRGKSGQMEDGYLQ